jgi:hypothetical protein
MITAGRMPQARILWMDSRRTVFGADFPVISAVNISSLGAVLHTALMFNISSRPLTKRQFLPSPQQLA